MRNKLILLLFTLFFSLSLQAQQATISGKVVDVENSNPIHAVNIYLENTNIGTITDRSGEFKIKNVPLGDYRIIVSTVGLKRIKQDITVREGINRFDFSLEKSTEALGAVVVTGTATPHHLKRAPVQTQLISSDEIKTSAPSDFNELMLNVNPSVDLTPGSMGAFLTMNGLANDFVLILIDGKRMYGDVGGHSDLNRINPDDVERIEIVKGASSSLYGSDAIAGVINVITKKSKNKINVSNATRYKQYNTFQQNNSIDLNLGKLKSSTSFSHKRTDGWQLSPYELDDDSLVATDKKAQNAYKDYTFYQKLSYAVTKKLEVYAQGSFYKKDVLYPESVKKYGFYFEDKQLSAGAKYLLQGKDYISVDYNRDQFKYFYKYNQDYKNYSEGDLKINNDQILDNVHVKYFNQIGETNRLIVGLDYMNEKMISEDRLIDGKADANTISLYAQDEMNFFKKLDIVVGGRLIQHKEFGLRFTPKATLLYNLKNFNFRASYGKGFKAPTVKELYYNYEKRGTVYMGNTDLKPQTSDYYSVGVEYINNRISTSVNVYRNNVKNLIAYQTIDLLPGDQDNGIKRRRKHFNIEDVQTQGVDVSLNAKLPYGFVVGAGYSYVDAMNLTKNIRLERIASNYGNMSLAYNHVWGFYALNATLLGRIQDEKFYEDGNAKAYNLWKLSTTHTFSNLGNVDLSFTAGIDNITDYVDDSPYGSHYGTLSPGRTYFVGLIINFAH